MQVWALNLDPPDNTITIPPTHTTHKARTAAAPTHAGQRFGTHPRGAASSSAAPRRRWPPRGSRQRRRRRGPWTRARGSRRSRGGFSSTPGCTRWQRWRRRGTCTSCGSGRTVSDGVWCGCFVWVCWRCDRLCVTGLGWVVDNANGRINQPSHSNPNTTHDPLPFPPTTTITQPRRCTCTSTICTWASGATTPGSRISSTPST